MSEIDFESDDALAAALSEAAAQDAAAGSAEQASFTGTAPTPPAGESAQPAAPVEQPAPEAHAPSPDSPPLYEGTPVNPDQLIAEHPELEPFVKQLTGEWTKKTQGLADQRREIEALGSIEELQQAIDLVNQISDPSNWGELHRNLSAAMQEQGLLPATPAAPTPQVPGFEDVTDPEMAPVLAALQAQRAELDQLKAQRAYEAQTMAAERERQQLLGNLQQAENEIVAAHPDYKQDDIDMTYQLASFFGADLGKANERLEAYVEQRLQRFLEAKKASTPTPGPAPKPDPNLKTDGSEMTLKDIEDEMVEHIRALQAAGELDV